jgi:hypothetical protein
MTTLPGDVTQSASSEPPSSKKRRNKVTQTASSHVLPPLATTEVLRSSANLSNSNVIHHTADSQPTKKKRKRNETENTVPDVSISVTSTPLPIATAPLKKKTKPAVANTPALTVVPSSVEHVPTENVPAKKKHKSYAPQPAAEAVPEAESAKKLAGPKKRKGAEEVQALVEFDAEGDDERHVPAQAKSGRSKRKAKDSYSAESPQKKGAFSTEEFAALDKVIGDIRASDDISKEDMNRFLHANGNNLAQNKQAPANLWNIICAAVPNRPRQSVQKCVRRKYYNCTKRAGWNDEEDSELLDAYLKWPNQWRKIGEAIGRHEEECRYRYRDYLKCGPQHRFDMWDGEEEQTMLRIVEDLRKLAEKDHKQKVKAKLVKGPFDSAGFQPNFNLVAEKLKSRSRLQCSNKYGKLMNQEQKANDSASSKAEAKRLSQRVAQAEKNFNEKMTYGDKYACLNAILEGMIKFKMTKEEKIPWGEIQKANRDSRWESAERRIVFQKYKDIAGIDTTASTIDNIRIMIRYMERKHPKSLLYTYYEGAKQKRQSTKGSRKIKSKATVSDADADDADDAEADSQVTQSLEGSPVGTANSGPVVSSSESSNTDSDESESVVKNFPITKVHNQISHKVSSKKATAVKPLTATSSSTSSPSSSSSNTDNSAEGNSSESDTSGRKLARTKPATKNSTSNKPSLLKPPAMKLSSSNRKASKSESFSESETSSSEPSSESDSSSSTSSD